MRTYAPILAVCLVWAAGCAEDAPNRPAGPVAGYGTVPVIDGVFDDGEWDDAAVVSVDTTERFRIKHDGKTLYFGLRAGGGDVWFDRHSGLSILHWSAQLGSLHYARTDSGTQSLDEPFDYELWRLQDEAPEVAREALDAYLVEHGWTANIAPLGALYQSELAVSFEWLGVEAGADRFVEIPGVRIAAGLLIARADPRAESLMAMPLEERKARYPMLYWPSEPAPDDSIGGGRWPETIPADAAEFGRIWIDLGGGDADGKQ